MKSSIIVIDENPAICCLIANVLSKNFKVLTHTDCFSAANDLKKKDIRLMILNVEDTSSKNFFFLFHLHFSSLYAHIPVYVITKNATTEIQSQCAELGVIGFFLKPFDPLILFETLKDHLYSSGVSYARPV